MLLLLTGCIYESIPILPYVPENVSYLSLSHNSSSNTFIANGTNKVEFTIRAYDKNKQPLGNLGFFELKHVKIEVSNGEIISSPYQFSTTTPGSYTFKIQNLALEHNLSRIESLTLDALEEQTRETVTLPVIFHFITNEKLSDPEKSMLNEKFQKRISEVNEMFANQFGSVDPNAAKVFINFTLAKTDPSGNELIHKGLDVIEISSFSPIVADSVIENIVWNGNFWTPKQYVNVWVILMDNNYSWAYFPDLQASSQDFPISIYGVVYNKKHIDINWVLAHEFGHMLNLWHVFNDNQTCEDADQCKDTWSYARKYDDNETVWQLKKENNCKETFISNNYMDYWPSEFNTFSLEQSGRVHYTLDNCPFLPIGNNANGRQGSNGYSNLKMKRVDERPYRIY